MEKPEPGTATRQAGPVRVTVSSDAGDHADVKNIGWKGRVSVAWVVREAVSRHLDARTPLFSRNNTDAGS